METGGRNAAQRRSGRATDGNNATRKGRRTGAMQRSGRDGRRIAAERRRTAHVERRAEVVRIYGKGQGRARCSTGRYRECVSSGCCGAYTRGGS
ncbi:unnamed protein product [Sphagnum balticum]